MWTLRKQRLTQKTISTTFDLNLIHMKNLLLALLAVMFALPATGQKEPSKKELTKKLNGSTWKVIKTWDGHQEDDKPFEWAESTITDSRLAEYFGAVQISFKSDGKFSAVGVTRNSFSGKWSAKRGLSFTYRDSEDYDHHVEFDKIQLTTTGFIASGDICHDGCYAKAEFEKVK
jgi:hypothetical protein